MLRRLVGTTAVMVGLPLAVMTAPVWIVASVAVDLVGGLRRFPSLRLGCFAVVYLVHQWAGVGWAAWLAVVERVGGRSRLIDYRDTQLWWAASLLRWARRLLGVDFRIEGESAIPDTAFVLLSRHASMVDAVLPIVLIIGRLDRYAHYVLKDELLWDPAINVYGSRLGNWFVTRGRRSEHDLRGISDMAARARPESALVIFPEGTYATPANRRRVARSLARRADAGEIDTAVVDYAGRLDNLLPPQTGGTAALLDAKPEADVVILGHVGLEGVAELKGLRRRLPLTNPVVLRWWTHPRERIPPGADGLEQWLQARWLELDRWVGDVQAARQAAVGPPPLDSP